MMYKLFVTHVLLRSYTNERSDHKPGFMHSSGVFSHRAWELQRALDAYKFGNSHLEGASVIAIATLTVHTFLVNVLVM